MNEPPSGSEATESPSQAPLGAPQLCAEEDTGLAERMSDAYLLGRLLPALVHATSNDLQVVLGATELLAAEPSSPTAHRRLDMIAEAATEGVDRMADLRALVLTVSDAAGRFASASSTVPFADRLAERLARLARLALGGTKVAIEVEPRLGAAPPPVPSDRQAVERLLGCLVLHLQALSPAKATLRLGIGEERAGGSGARCTSIAIVCITSGEAPEAPAEPDHPDLELLRSLVARAGGTLARDARRPDDGTKLTVTLPLRPSA